MWNFIFWRRSRLHYGVRWEEQFTLNCTTSCWISINKTDIWISEALTSILLILLPVKHAQLLNPPTRHNVYFCQYLWITISAWLSSLIILPNWFFFSVCNSIQCNSLLRLLIIFSRIFLSWLISIIFVNKRISTAVIIFHFLDCLNVWSV